VTARLEVPVACVDVRAEDVEAVGEVLASGRLRQGRVTAEFEEAFAERVGSRHAVAVSSGTAALHLCYLALFRPGDEVVVPAFTFAATATMLVAAGAVPVFADVDQRTFTLSTEAVRRQLTGRTRGIVGVHLFGNVCDIDGLAGLAAERGLTLVWDAAQALGSEYRGSDVGSFPTAVCYSFYPTKTITTGEGGMVTTDDDELAATLRLMRSQGATGKYVHSVLGFNFRMTDFQAALGIRQLARLDEYVESRRKNAQVLSSRLQDVDGVLTPFMPDYAHHTFHQYSVLVDEGAFGMSRDDLARHLAEMGVETAIHYPRPLHRQPVFSGSHADLPVSDRLCRQVLALPVHPGLSHEQVEWTADAVAACTGSR
jgi:perosamine synthetase